MQPAHLLLLLVLPGLSGCAALFIAGAGAGAYTYVSGNLVREYQADFKSVVNASFKTLNQLQFSLIRKTGDGLWISIEGERSDGTPVTIELERLGPARTEVGVRTGIVGYMNLQVSEQVHEFIAAALSETEQYSKINLVEPAEAPTAAKVIKQSPGKKKVKSAAESVQKSGTGSVIKIRDTVVAEDLNYLKKRQDTMYVYFQKNENSVTGRMYKTLDKAVKYLLENESARVAVHSYTDSTGNTQENLVISRLRAVSVRRYFVSKGVKLSRITAKGFGATNFIEKNSTEQLRAMNRRVELHFSE